MAVCAYIPRLVLTAVCAFSLDNCSVKLARDAQDLTRLGAVLRGCLRLQVRTLWVEGCVDLSTCGGVVTGLLRPVFHNSTVLRGFLPSD